MTSSWQRGVRRRAARRAALATLLAGALAALPGCVDARSPRIDPGDPCALPMAPAGSRVLVFSRTEGFRHGAIADGRRALDSLGAAHGFAVDTTEGTDAFTDANLARYGAVVFLSTTGDVLDAPHEAAFERYIRAGGAFVGIHAAADTEYDWPWYGALVGGVFAGHPPTQPALVDVLTTAQLATRCLATPWSRTDEWYDFSARPPARATILATVAESSYTGGGMGNPHPVAWQQQVDGGRSWYTAMGHTPESYAEPAFLRHLAGGVLWALGAR